MAVKELNNNLGGCQLTQEGNDFFIIGADSVRKKLDSHEIVLLGTVTSTTTFDLSDYTGYETFELDKNILGYVSGSYDQSTGILTVNQNTVSGYVCICLDFFQGIKCFLCIIGQIGNSCVHIGGRLDIDVIDGGPLRR